MHTLQSILGLLTFTTKQNLTQIFGPGLSSDAQIILPDSPNWGTEIRQRWSTYQAPTYVGAIKPAVIGDIQHIIKVARTNKIPFFVTGGGHGISNYEGFKGVGIDLGNFKNASIDEQDILTVSASTEFSQLSHTLQKAGKELPLASCPCVGVIGATLGGGIGPLAGYRGLMVDALQSVDMVTASGDLITASETGNPDLFWAVRGAGANFGVVTSAKFKLYDITNEGNAMVADFVYPAVANQSFFEALKTFDHDLPAKMALTAVAVYNRTIEQPLLVMHAVYFGPQDEGKGYLGVFSRINHLATSVRMVPQSALFPADHGACQPNQRINLYTTALMQIEPKVFGNLFESLVEMWHRYPDYEGRLLIERYATNGAMQKPIEATAYPWRRAVAHVNMENFYQNPEHDETINNVIMSAREEMARDSGFRHLATYSNFAHGDEGPVAWYSAEFLPRLSSLKRQWDPTGLFSWHNPVPLDWPEEV